MSTSAGKFGRPGAAGAKISVLAPKFGSTVVGVSRLALGFLFACHGVASLFGVFGKQEVAVGAWPGFYAAVIQLVCGVLVMAGALTRSAAVLGSGSMAYAYFTVHQSAGALPIVNGGEEAAVFCWSLLLLAATGPGALALGPTLSALFGTRAQPGSQAVDGSRAQVAPSDPERVAA